MGKVLSHPVSFILMLGAWRAGLKGLSAMSKGGENPRWISKDSLKTLS